MSRLVGSDPSMRSHGTLAESSTRIRGAGLGAASPLSQGCTLGYFRSLPTGGFERGFAADLIIPKLVGIHVRAEARTLRGLKQMLFTLVELGTLCAKGQRQKQRQMQVLRLVPARRDSLRMTGDFGCSG